HGCLKKRTANWASNLPLLRRIIMECRKTCTPHNRGKAPMSYAKLRQKLAFEAARLMYENQISFQKATQQAVQRVAGGFVSRKALPTQREIRAEIAKLDWVNRNLDERLLEPPEPDRFAEYAALLAPLEQ